MWLNKIETKIRIITSIFSRTIILTGDTNITTRENSKIQERYKELLNNSGSV